MTNSISGVGQDRFVDLGLTYRQLDHWTTRGYLRPLNPDAGIGRPRHYPIRELRIARLMLRLVNAGWKPEAAHEHARMYITKPGPMLVGAGLTLYIEEV